MKLQRYNLKVVYKKGKEMYIADALSCAYTNERFEFEVMTVESTTSALSPPRYDELVNATAADDDLS